MKLLVRKINFFEITLLIVGIGVGIVGFFVINDLYKHEGIVSWQLFQTVFLWLLLIVMLVLAATMEDVKEELAIVIKEHIEETRLLKQEVSITREIQRQQLDELRLVSKNLKKR
ncbi:MAG: hypothetical protein QXK37_04390 [Candidatus Woesearchaeota archaeon]